MKVKLSFTSIFLILLLTTCQTTAAPSATSTETIMEPSITETVVTLVPSPTLTFTPTPTITPVGFPPVIVGLEGQSIAEDERFENIDLLESVTDRDHTPEEITWSFTGNEALTIRQSGSTLMIVPLAANWAGSETIVFEACDPDGLCTSEEVAFTVIAVNDPPTVNIANQTIQLNSAFEDVVLAKAARDVDHTNEELTWQISGNSELAVEISNGQVSVSPPDGTWSGSETIQFEICDPEGGCASTTAEYTVLGTNDVQVTYIFNAGFLITTGDQKILIDALNKGLAIFGGESPPQEIIDKLENAKPPFDHVNLILTTHEDVDHFDAEMVQKHLANNPEAIFVSTSRTVEQLKSFPEQERLVALDLADGESTQLNVQGIDIEAIYLTHGEGRPNLGYIFTVGGKKLFHTGDLYVELIDVSYIENYGIPEKEIDVAFVPIFSLHPERNHREIFASFQAQYLVLMHYYFPYEDAQMTLMYEYFPDAIIFQSGMRSWLVP